MNIHNPSLLEKEQFVVETILSCSSILYTVKQKHNLTSKLFETSSPFNNNLEMLFESITGYDYSLYKNNSNITKNPNILNPKDFRNNNYAYLQAVNNSLDSYDKTIITNLNESINNLGFDINAFKLDIQDTITQLEKINDFENYDKLPIEIRKIKIWARKPIYIFGFDIINNQALRNELANRYKIDISTALISILFDKSNKQILFIFTGNIIVYDIKTNQLDYYNQIGRNILMDEYDENSYLNIPNIEKINKDNYMGIITEAVNNNMLKIYENIDLLDMKFTDNLYQDGARSKYLEKNKQYSDNNFLVKIPQQ